MTVFQGTEPEDFVECRICGKKLKFLNVHHFWSIRCKESQMELGIDVSEVGEYQDFYPAAPTRINKPRRWDSRRPRGSVVYPPRPIEESIQCLECGEWYGELARHVSLKHSLLPSEYLDKHPGAELTAKIVKIRRSAALLGHGFSEETIAKMKKVRKGKTYDEIFGVEESARIRKSLSESGTRRWADPREREKQAVRMRRLWANDPEYAETVMRHARESSEARTEEQRRAFSETVSVALTGVWANYTTEERAVRLKKSRDAMQIRPTSIEVKLQDIVDKNNLPIQYIGDTFLPEFCGYSPDFVVQTGKGVIEVWGRYWHRNDSPKDRIKIMDDIGYRCLIVWEEELLNEEILVGRLTEFILGVG